VKDLSAWKSFARENLGVQVAEEASEPDRASLRLDDGDHYIALYQQHFRDTDAGSMLRVKGQAGFCPIGPGLVRGVGVRQITLRTYRNGKIFCRRGRSPR
jgi:hypothetical protein